MKAGRLGGDSRALGIKRGNFHDGEREQMTGNSIEARQRSW